MNDQRRITRICEKLCIIWEYQPEKELRQFLTNMMENCSNNDNKTEQNLDDIIIKLYNNKK